MNAFGTTIAVFANTIDSAARQVEGIVDRTQETVAKVAPYGQKAYEALTSPQAKRKYKTAYKMASQVAEILVLLALVLVKELDLWIKSHEVQAAEPIAPTSTPEPASVSAPAHVPVAIDSVAELNQVKELAAPVFARKAKVRKVKEVAIVG